MTASDGADIPLRPLPELEGDAAPFWQAAREHRLVVQRCEGCGEYRFPPEPGCYACGAATFRWSELSGRATLYSWTLAHPPVLPYFAARVPVAIVAVQLEEGPRMVSNLVGLPPSEYRFDMPLQADFEDAGENTTLLVFRPA